MIQNFLQFVTALCHENSDIANYSAKDRPALGFETPWVATSSFRLLTFVNSSLPFLFCRHTISHQKINKQDGTVSASQLESLSVHSILYSRVECCCVLWCSSCRNCVSSASLMVAPHNRRVFAVGRGWRVDLNTYQLYAIFRTKINNRWQFFSRRIANTEQRPR
jgi:hypothetical protein